MNRALPLLIAFVGFFAGVFVFGLVGRWLYALMAVVREHRSIAHSGLPQKRLASVLLPIVVLHSGPWALAIGLVLSYYVLLRPHSPDLLWFFSGAGIGLLFMLLIAARAARRVTAARANSAASTTSTPGSSAERAASPRATIAQDTYEGYRLRMWAALWTSLPVSVILSAMWWDSIVRAPELLIIIAVLSFLFAYVLGAYFRLILFPKSWRPPPRK